MEEGTITTQPETGVPAETGSQETQATPQGAPESQENGQPQGRGDGQQPSSNGETRKPSEFYKERQKDKKWRESVEGFMSEIKEQIKALGTKTPAVSPQPTQEPKFNYQRFWNTPDQVLEEVLSAREKELIQSVKKDIMENELPRVMQESERRRESVQGQQEALELMFPKSNMDDKRTLENRVQDDPQRSQRIEQILVDYKLDVLATTHPRDAANIVLKLLNAERPLAAPKNPNAINKKLTGSTATGSPVAAGGKQMPTLAEIKAQREILASQVDKNPDLRYDPEWQKKSADLKNQLTVLYKELEKQQ